MTLVDWPKRGLCYLGERCLVWRVEGEAGERSIRVWEIFSNVVSKLPWKVGPSCGFSSLLPLGTDAFYLCSHDHGCVQTFFPDLA
jgi:hypothetical protein